MQSVASILTAAGVDLTVWTLDFVTGVSADGNTVVGYGINPDGLQEAWMADLSDAPPVNGTNGMDINLVYVAVEPCRLADTRKTSVLTKGIARHFHVSGADLSGQGGGSCVHPKEGTNIEPLAASVYLVAVPTGSSGGGWLTAFHSDQTPPASNSVATVNYAKWRVVGNTTIATLCQPDGCPTDGQLGLVSFNSEQNVVIDVQGYFYPLSGGDGQVAAGLWQGTGQGIYADGTTAEIVVTVDLYAVSDFVYGTAGFTVDVDGSAIEQAGQISGHIQGNAINGIFGGCMTVAPDCAGGAIFEGKVTGDELNGSVVDLNDGSTITLTLQRTCP